LAATGSFKRYWQLDALFRAQDLADGRAYVELGVRHRDAPRDNFFGLGSATSLDDRTSYALQMTTVTGGGGIEIGRDVTLSGDVEYLRPRVSAGQDDRHLSIEERFSDLDAPGLTTEPELLYAGATLAYEGRDQPGNPRRGGRYAASWGHTQDLDEDRYAFQRLMFDVEQVIPFWSDQRRIVLRGVAVQTDPDEGREVPFYLMPALGGGNTLRGFKQDRFRDRSALLLRAEYRYELNAFLVAALFTDVGQVAPSWDAMRRRDFKRNYGFGLRFGTATVVLRTDVAFGSGEGTRLVLRFGGAF
ncbi:MAG: BamA/TamA family outer membrane protein, partial [Vicinamibacteraceae bacterium]